MVVESDIIAKPDETFLIVHATASVKLKKFGKCIKMKNILSQVLVFE